jgi:hypothetical protein
MKSLTPSLLVAVSVRTVSASSIRQENEKGLIVMPLIPHHLQIQRRRLDRPPMDYSKSEPNKDPFEMGNSALYQGYGTHYVDLWVGTPPQRQTVIVDTGSSVTAFPCMDCSGCGDGYHIDNYFQEDLSTTFEDVECKDCLLGSCGSSPLCELSVSYQEGSSWKAYECSDLSYMGGPHDEPLEPPPKDTFRLRFGCQTRLTGLFKTQLADGIMGMEMSPSSYWRQAHDAGIVKTKIFSLCFSRQPVASKEGTGAGVMTLGGTDTRLHGTKMVYVNQLNLDGWYSVKIRAIYLRTGGGTSVEADDQHGKVRFTKLEGMTERTLNNGDIILDSGTTDTYLPSTINKAFRDAWQKASGLDWKEDAPIKLTDDQLLALPTILVQLQGWEGGEPDPMAPGLAGSVDADNPNDVVVAMPPTHYMEYSVKSQTYTPRISFSESHGGVFGANFMMGHEIMFDVDSLRVGFSESDCDYATVADEESSG